MTSPSLFINRLVVEGVLHCDISFKHGLNILQAIDLEGSQKGTNKSGKTALVELIQHGLGKTQKNRSKYHFAPIINQIKTLWLEVEANGSTFTIERSLQEITARAKIHEGPYVPGMTDSNTELVSIEQMSSALLGSLAIPQISVRTKEGELTPLTFQLLMRAFVLHQEDSFGAILDKVIPDQRRADIIGFLTEITPLERYTLEDELSKIQLEVQAVDKYYSSVQDFLNKNGIPSLIEAEARVREMENVLNLSKQTQYDIQKEIKENTISSSRAGNGQLDIWRRQILQDKEESANIERKIAGLQKELERLKEVVSSLRVDRNKYQRLQSSSLILSTVEFSICPRCLLEITPEMKLREENARCSLCNRPLRTTSDVPPRAAQIPKDINSQIAETETLIRNTQKELESDILELEKVRVREEEIGNAIDKESQVYVAPSLDRLLTQSSDISQKEADLANARALLNQAEALNTIRKQIDGLRRQLAILEDKLRDARKPNRTRIETLREIYQQILTQIDFPDFQSCSIDSQSLMPNINDNMYIHVGTALKGLAAVSYHLALLSLSRREDTFFPKMLVIDSPAVGDLNNENHDKLLKYLASLQPTRQTEKSLENNNQDLDWQIILTTRRIIPELESNVFKKISAPNHMLLEN